MKTKYLLPMFLMTSFAALAAMPNDNEITQIVETVNSGEIKMAEYALKTTKNPEVKKFAEHMKTDHTMNEKKTEALGVTPLANAKSMALKNEGESSMNKLKTLKGAEFDKAYIADQLKAHENVLKDLKTTLIPNAKNPELKAHLEMTAKKVETHIEHAKSIQTTL
jgi:putative membrane protein